MRNRLARVILLAALAVPAFLAAQDASSDLEFDVVSIKLHAAGDRGGSGTTLSDGTVRVINNPLIGILGGAYPSESGEYIGLPAWMQSERYDVILKPPANATLAPRGSTERAAQDRVMMRKMFTDRMKLVVHDETRDEPTYALVLARPDGKLGPQLKPRPDCIAEAQAARAARAGDAPTPPPAPPSGPPSESVILSRCGGYFSPGHILSGGMNMEQLSRQLRNLAGRFVENRTGLDGWYTIDLRFAAPRPGGPATTAAIDPGDAPEIFTALQEQLGLKLEPARKTLQVVVIDHIERPDPN